MEERGALGEQRVDVRGVGPGQAPAARLRHETILRETGRALPREAARALEADLRRACEGEVRFDDAYRALYATDASNYRQVPIGVCLPRSLSEVEAIVGVCRRHGAPVLARGGGTSLAGQCCNVAVVIDFTKHLHRVLSLDPDRREAWVEPGLVLDDLRSQAERHHLTFGPDPSTHTHCTLGGMIGNDSCGVHSVMAGRMDENLHALDVLLYDGTRLEVSAAKDGALATAFQGGGARAASIARALEALRDRVGGLVRERMPQIPRRVSGYRMDALLPERGAHVARSLVGSEGTCAITLRAKVRLVPSPPSRVLVALGYPDVFAAGDAVPEILRHGPIGLEGLDDRLVADMTKKRLHPERTKLLPEGKGWLLAEFGGADRREGEAHAERLVASLRGKPGRPEVRIFDDPRQEEIVWKVRESGLGATARVPGSPDTWEGWEDSAVHPEKLGSYLRRLRALFDDFGYACALYGHFGQGCVHTRIDFDLATRDGIARFRAFLERAAELVVSLGGSLSGEHGDGQSRAELLPRMYGEELVRAFSEFKRIWDPEWKLNPGKVVQPYRLDENLRLGEGFREARPATYFRYPEDDGKLGRAVLRCVGVGECRREHGGVMCPSYMVTREEQHSTRGRARLLFEMLEGDPLSKGWREEGVREALDLCLACKGCKSDCPMNVDMATYKAEFLAHHYHRRLRPRAAYAMGLVREWSRLAALAPGLVNAAARTPGLSTLMKLAGGIAHARELPRFAPVTFRQWFRARLARPEGRPVLLFPDTFSDHFHPRIAVAAVEVLERAGFRVEIPDRPLCCGRPLYDFGMLDRARARLRELVEGLEPYAGAGIPIVGLEPSCVAVLRDELPAMLGHDPRSLRISKASLTLSELIDREGDRFPLPRLERRALMQGHCHHHAVMGLDAEVNVLKQLGLDVARPDTGCCGMAGSFGFERGDKYRVSIAAGERALLPEVRRAAADVLILADGFSCREQIRQGTGRRALHLAEVIRAGWQGGDAGALREPEVPARLRLARRSVAVAALALGASLVVRAVMRRRRERR
jgi:FAD/FMN-containing dehydrogenase/Fe-S oxidoreductase